MLRALHLRKLLKKFDQELFNHLIKNAKIFAKPLAFANTM
jgi:hypothetical protein